MLKVILALFVAVAVGVFLFVHRDKRNPAVEVSHTEGVPDVKRSVASRSRPNADRTVSAQPPRMVSAQGLSNRQVNKVADAQAPAKPSYAPVDPRIEQALDHSLSADARLKIILDLNNSGARISTPEDLDAVSSILLDSTEDDTLRHEVANLLQRHGYAPLTDQLFSVLENPAEAERFRSFCVQHLWRRCDEGPPDERERILPLLETLLTDKDTAVRREALLAMVREKMPIGEQTAITWLQDPNAQNLHDLAIRCMRELNLRETIPAIRPFLESTNESARIAAIVTLSEWKDEPSRKAIKETAQSPILRMQRAGIAGLNRFDQDDIH